MGILFSFLHINRKLRKEIRERKSAEATLRQTQQELMDTIKYQQGMIFKFKEVKGKFIHTLNDGQLMYQMGLTSDQIVGKELKDFLPPHIAAVKEKHYRRAWNGEIVIYEGQCNGITYLAQLRPIIRNGQVVEVIASCVDITERKTAEEMLRKSEKLAVAGQMAAGIAHEMRNPLTTIKGMVQLMESNIVKKEYFELILMEIERMESIIGSFLGYARPLPVKYGIVDIRSLLDECITLFTAEGNMKNIVLLVRHAPEDALIMGDSDQIKQVFINIMKNAFEAMPKGGSIEIQTVVDSNAVSIQFTDYGHGISKERLARIGEPFYSTKEKGTGLGMMVSYRIVQEHKGTIKIDSEIDLGTTVEVSFPLADGSSFPSNER